MAGPSVVVRVLGDLKGLGSSFDAAGAKADGFASKGRAAFNGMLSTLNQTGVLGPFAGTLDSLGQAMDTLTGKGKNVGAALMGAGAGLTGAGAGLSLFGSKEAAAQNQLKTAIEATGGSWDDYSAKVEEAIKTGEKYGDTGSQTQNALQALTQATHDPAKALDMLNETFDIAAAKHEDVATAAGQLGKVFNGNKKILKEFGIQVDANTGLTKDGQTATEALAKVVGGQASAAADTFGGKLAAVKARVEDSVAAFGQKYGPAITAAGVAMTGLGSAITVTQGILGLFKGSQEAAAVATEGLAAAEDVEAVSAWAALGPVLLIIGAVAALVAIGYVLYENWDTIWSAIQTAVEAVWTWISDHWPLLLGILLGPIGIAVDLIVTYWDQIKAGAGAAVDFIRSVWDGLVAFFSAIPGRVAGFFAAIWDGIKNGATSAHDWVSDRVNDLVAIFTGLPGRLAGVFSGMFDGISDAFKAALSWIVDHWNMLHFTMPSFDTHIPGIGSVGGFDVGVPPLHIPGLATGGTVTREGIFYLHAGEAVTPARSGPAVQIEHAHFSDEVDVDVFMARAAWAVQTRAM
jgi:hypothetical protein